MYTSHVSSISLSKKLICLYFSCAFSNTPKFNQVKQTGKGFIVNKQWILDCYKQNQFLSEKNYELKGTNNHHHEQKPNTPNKRPEKPMRTFDDDDDDEEENQEPLISKDVTRKPTPKKKMMTFDDEDDDDDDEGIS